MSVASGGSPAGVPDLLRNRPILTWPRRGSGLSRLSSPIPFWALSGRAGQPGPQAENRGWGEMETRWRNQAPSWTKKSTMVEEPEAPEESKKLGLAAAIASGMSISRWARQNGVPKTTACRWAQDDTLRAKVHVIRRRVLDRAVGALNAPLRVCGGRDHRASERCRDRVGEAQGAQGDPGGHDQRVKVHGTRRAHCQIRGTAPP